MLTITCDAQDPAFYTFDLYRHDLPVHRMLRASFGDSALVGFVSAAPSARWEHVVVVVCGDCFGGDIAASVVL